MRTAASLSLRVVVALVLIAFVVVACGDDDAGFDVTSEVVSHESTQDILVFAPDTEGAFPVVYAMHGIGGRGEDMAETAERLASHGFVVFAPTYRTDMATQAGTIEAIRDAECGYRYARTVAAEHGGDLDRPITFLGFSLGASLVIDGGLTEVIDPTGEILGCFDEVPRADVIVAVSGCHYEFEGAQFDFDPSGLDNEDAHLVVVAGDEDTVCPAWQSEDARTALTEAGYDVDFAMLEGANHFVPIYHDIVDGEWVVVEHPAGDRVVEIVVDAIADAEGTAT